MSKAKELSGILAGMVECGAPDPETLYTENQPDGDPFVARSAVLLCEQDAEITRLRAELAEARKDAERWRILPAFFEEYQINGLKLFNDIDAAIAKEKSE